MLRHRAPAGPADGEPAAWLEANGLPGIRLLAD